MNLSGLTEYIRQFNWLIVMVTLLVFFGLIKLGLWQTARAVEKEQRLLRIATYQKQTALSLQAILQFQASQDDINDLPIQLVGTFDKEKVFLLDNQTNKGRLGYQVLQVLQLEYQSVLINLGWVQGYIDRSKLPDIQPLIGKHTIKGNIRIPEQGILLAEQMFTKNQWPLRVQQIELDKFSQIIAQKLLPFVVYLDKKEGIGFEKNWQPIVMPPEKHRAYAFQWFSLAAAWLLLMISASVWFYKNNNK